MKQEDLIPLMKYKNGGSPFRVQAIKDFVLEQDDVVAGPHSHDYFEMVWMIAGDAKLHVDMQEYEVGNNTIFCIRPGQAHQFPLQVDMDGFVFSFTDSFFKMDEYDFDWAGQANLFQLFSECRPIRIAHEVGEDMREIVLRMVKENENQDSYRVELLKRYFKIFMIYLIRKLGEALRAAEQTRETELVRNFMEMLDKNFKEKKMVADYAAQLSVTSNYLNRIVKKNTGLSAGHHIRQRVVLEAKRMGRYSDAGMKEIAYSLGFLDSAHFSKFFKTFAGLNFSDFKRGGLVVSFNSFNRA